MNIHSPSKHVLVKRAHLSAITAATATGTVIDTMGFSNGMVVLHASPSGTGTTLNAKLQAGDLADGSDMADVTGGAFAQSTTVGGANTQVIDFDVLTKRYIRVSATGAGGSAAGQYSAEVLLFNPNFSPVTQDVAATSVTI